MYLKLEIPSRCPVVTRALTFTAGLRAVAGESTSVRGVGLQHRWDHRICNAEGRLRVGKGKGYNRACSAIAMSMFNCVADRLSRWTRKAELV